MESSSTAEGSVSPRSADSNSNIATSSLRMEQEVTPSVSLIPIKQESEETKREPVRLHSSTLIKVSPLKSLLRDDLKRRGTAVTVGTVHSDTNSRSLETSLWQCSTLKRHPFPSSLHCSFCGIGFPDQTLYFLHKGCHSESNPWKCNICGEQCCNVYDFNSHLLSKTHE